MSWTHMYSLKNPRDLETLLGISIDSDREALRRAYSHQSILHPDKKHDIKLACKIASDPFYRDAFIHYQTLEALDEAGYFDDGLEPGMLDCWTNPFWLTTPLAKIIRAAEQLKQVDARPWVVLLSTGGFAPIHDGHVLMMNIARKKLMDHGYHVAGGFFSTSHDGYVLAKCDSITRLTAPKRLHMLHHALKDSDWLSADPWEALYTPCAISFTDVYARLQHYISTHITTHPIEVAYVYGGDNAYFFRPFCKRGMSVCIARPGFEEKFERAHAQARQAPNTKHLFFSDSNDAQQVSLYVSSQAIRKGSAEPIAHIKAKMEGYLAPRPSVASGMDQAYLIRDDLDWAIKPWQDLLGGFSLASRVRSFLAHLGVVFEQAFAAGNDPFYPRKIQVQYLPSQQQEAVVKQLLEEAPVVNLDIVTSGYGHAIGFSRLFDVSDMQLQAHAMIKRPGSDHIASRLASLQPGRYYLVDDDIATGHTMNMVEAILPEDIKIIEKISLAETTRLTANQEVWDIVDARDFLLGSRASGLVVKLFNGEVARAPYLVPFVSLAARASVPPDKEQWMTSHILALNRQFHEGLPYLLCLEDTDEDFQKLMLACGFTVDSRMLDVIDWYQSLLPNIVREGIKIPASSSNALSSVHNK